MKKFCETIKSNKITICADERMEQFAVSFFKIISNIPLENIYDGFKFEIGFSVFICRAESDGYKLFVPDYANSPLVNTTDNFTAALQILFNQLSFLKQYGISGVDTRFDDEIIVSENAFKSKTLCLQRYPNLGGGQSGWCVEAVEKTSDGKFPITETKNYKKIYAYQLLENHPYLIKALAAPYNYIVVYDNGDIVEILNENDVSVLD